MLRRLILLTSFDIPVNLWSFVYLYVVPSLVSVIHDLTWHVVLPLRLFHVYASLHSLQSSYHISYIRSHLSPDAGFLNSSDSSSKCYWKMFRFPYRVMILPLLSTFVRLVPVFFNAFSPVGAFAPPVPSKKKFDSAYDCQYCLN